MSIIDYLGTRVFGRYFRYSSERVIGLSIQNWAILQSNSVITNRLGLIKFVRYNREFVVSELINVVNMDFGTEKMWKICL